MQAQYPNVEPAPPPARELAPPAVDVARHETGPADPPMGTGDGLIDPAAPLPVNPALARPVYNTVSLDNPPCVGMVLANGQTPIANILKCMSKYADAVGFTQRYNQDRPGPLGNNRVRIMCDHSRTAAPSVKHVDPSKHRDKRSKRIGCPYSVTLMRTDNRPDGVDGTCDAFFDGGLAWAITIAAGLEHGPCPGIDGRCHPLHPHKHDFVPDQAFPQEVRDRLKHYVCVGDCSMRQIQNLLAKEFPELLIEDKQLYNEVGAVRPKADRQGQCRRLLEILLRKQHNEDPGLKIHQLLDSEDRMKGVLWVTGEQRRAWLECGSDVLIHDNTYNVDQLGYKLGVFSGISKQAATVPLGRSRGIKKILFPISLHF